MDYTIKHVMTENELSNVLTFAKKVFGDHIATRRQKEEWLGYMKRNNELLLYATTVDEVVGIALGFIEDNGNMTIAAVGVDERLRMLGVAKEMMLMLEERAKTHGVHLIVLGAVQTAEGFYAKLGYNGSMLIQSEEYSIDELLSLNSKHKVRYTNVYDGKINQVCLNLPESDRELQHKYETSLPRCNVQMMFWKNI